MRASRSQGSPSAFRPRCLPVISWAVNSTALAATIRWPLPARRLCLVFAPRRQKLRARPCGRSKRLSQGEPSFPSLIKAVARAHDWVERIAKGEMPHQRAIAAETGLHRRYVGRIIQMAFLAPDITEAILEGRQPPHMTLETLMADMPADWAGQRKQLLTSYRPTA